MAKITADTGGLDAFINGTKGLIGDIGNIADEMLDESAPTVVDAWKKNIRAAADRVDDHGRPYSTGALEKSIKATKAKANAYGHFVAARPTGEDARGTRNGEKMAYLEYGTSKQVAHPTMAKTVAETEKEVTEKMTKTFEKNVDKYLK